MGQSTYGISEKVIFHAWSSQPTLNMPLIVSSWILKIRFTIFTLQMAVPLDIDFYLVSKLVHIMDVLSKQN